MSDQIEYNPSSHSTGVDYGVVVGAFRAFITPFVFVFGLIGNILVIILFSRESPRTRFSIYAIALAISHLIALVFNTLLDDFLGRGLLYASGHRSALKLDAVSEWGCKMMEYVPDIAYFCSGFTLVAFSIDRLLTVTWPLRFYSLHHRRAALGVCLGILAVACFVNLPVVFIQHLDIDSSSRTNFTCRMEEPSKVANFIICFRVLVIYTLPLLAVFFLNVLICRRLLVIRRLRAALMPAMDANGNRLEMGRVFGHLALSTSFLLLFLPLVCVVLIRLHLTLTDTDRHSDRALKIIDLSRLFSSVKDITYAVNFFMYFAFLANFRQRFLDLCSCCSYLQSKKIKQPHQWQYRSNETSFLTELPSEQL